MPKKGSTYQRRNPMRKRLVEEMLNGRTVTKASKIAGYAQSSSAWNALNAMRARGEMLETLDRIGWNPAQFAEKHIAKMLKRKKTIFFQNGGIVTDKREVEDTEAQQRAAEMYVKIRGAYAPIEVEHAGTVVHEITMSEKQEAEKSLELIKNFDSEVYVVAE